MRKQALTHRKKNIGAKAELLKQMTHWASDQKIIELLELFIYKTSIANTIPFIDFLKKHEKELKEFLMNLPKRTIRQTRDWIDSKLDTRLGKESKSPADVQFYQDSRIRLSQAEDRLIHSLLVMLSKNSETTDQNSPNYYMGNQEKGSILLKGLDTTENLPCEITFDTARLQIKPHELYTTYSGTDDYSGEQSSFIINSLTELTKKKFNLLLLSNLNNTRKRTTIKTFLPLWQLFIINPDQSVIQVNDLINNSIAVSENCFLLFKFSPIFTSNIRERYIELPEDMHLRIVVAAKCKRISECVHIIRDFLLREKQHKRYTVFRDEDTLVELCNLQKPWKKGRKKEIRTKLNKALEIFQTIGLIKKFTLKQGKRGQNQYEIHVNLDFK